MSSYTTKHILTQYCEQSPAGLLSVMTEGEICFPNAQTFRAVLAGNPQYISGQIPPQPLNMNRRTIEIDVLPDGCGIRYRVQDSRPVVAGLELDVTIQQALGQSK